jgi:menaquinone-dependent protoporphyrinogen oxidase
MKVLVGYATKHGSTAEVAQFIGNVLQEHALDITVAEVGGVSSAAGYDAFVIGSPVYEGMWLSEMSQFLERCEAEMFAKPVYYWMTCIRVLEPDGLAHARDHYVHKPTLDKFRVHDIMAFAGKLRFSETTLGERWALSIHYDGQELPGAREDDYRDWNAIRDWAVQVRTQLEGKA